MQQRVTLTLSIEVLSSGRLSEKPVLKQSWLPSQLTGRAVTIVHNLYPDNVPDGSSAGAELQKQFRKKLSAAAVVLPGIVVGNATVTGQLYSFAGQIADPIPINIAAMGGTAMVDSGGLTRGIASVFGDAAPAAAAPATAGGDTVVAEWLDIEIAVPGKAVEKQRRAVFDLIGGNKRASGAPLAAFAVDDRAALNRSLALSGTIDVWIAASAPSGDSMRAHAARQLSALASGLVPGGAAPDGNPTNPLFWRWQSIRELSGIATVFDRPNIALFWRKLAIAKDSSIVGNDAFDVVSNGVASDTHFDHRVAQGIADTIAEYVAIGEAAAPGNAAGAYRSDLTAGRPWAVLKPGKPRVPAVSGAAAARITDVLANQGLVIAPTQQLPASDGVSWWRIRNDGITLGIGEAGMGTATGEYSVPVKTAAGQARVLKFLGCAVLGTFSLALDQIGSPEGTTAWKTLKNVSLRTAAETAICLAGAGTSVSGLSKLKSVSTVWGATVADFTLNALYTLLTSPPGDTATSGQGSGATPPEPVPICRSPDDGC